MGAWFGKPHPVSCAFQPWLLGLPALSMIIALSVKIFRIWRIFNDKMNKHIISDWKLIILWFLLMLPAILIVLLWTIISTPTAKMTEVSGEDHYICRSDGFTIFFFRRKLSLLSVANYHLFVRVISSTRSHDAIHV